MQLTTVHTTSVLKRLIPLCFLLGPLLGSAQNSMIGDGFGGRSWYKPYNYTVGSYSAYTVCGDSDQLYSWGGNNHFELGDGSQISTTNPVKAMGMTNILYYSTGYNMGAIKKDSTGWIWGSPMSTFPLPVLTNAKFVDAGAIMCSFVKHDGTVWSVGTNSSGIFGNDTFSSTSTTIPKQAINVNSAVRVAVSRSNLGILLSNGTVMTTGTNLNGGLGTGASNFTIARRPVLVPKLKKIIDIKGTATNLAVLDSFGNVYTWGSYICLGNGGYTNQDTPVRVSNISDIVAISGCDDGFHFMALDANHNAYAWGANYGGSMGTGNYQTYNQPVLIATDVVDIMAGETFSYIVKTDGSLWAAGRSNGGSIWMNLKDTVRLNYTKIDPTIAPLNLCELPPFAGNYFYIRTIPCLYDSILVEAAPNDSFKNFHWDMGDGSPQIYGSKVKHKYANKGDYTVRLLSTRKSNNKADTITRSLTVHDASYDTLFSGDTLVCGHLAFTKYPESFNEEANYLWDDSSITFDRFINKSGLYTLRVTDAHGCHYADSFNVIQHEPPKALFKADTYSMCANSADSIHFTNLSTSVDSIVRCRWDFTEDTLSSTNSVIAYKYKKADYYPVFLSVWTKFGCRSDTIDVFDILPAPKPLFDLTIGDSCLNGNSITLINNTLRDTIQKPRFKWYFSEGYVLSNRNPTGPRTYSDTGRYYVDLIYTNTNKCTDTLRRYVHIYPHPVSDFVLNSPICSRDSIAFPNTTVSAYAPVGSLWQFGDQSQSALKAPSHQYARKGTYVVKLISTSPQGCKDSISKTLTVYNPPSAAFSVNDSIQCLADNVFRFTSQSKADSGALKLQQWYYGDQSSDTGRLPADKTFSSAQRFLVKLVVEDFLNCKDSISQWMDVRNGPTADFSINDASQCEDLQDFIFTYLPKAGNDSIQAIEWRVQSATYPAQPVLNLRNFPAGSSVVGLLLKSDFGCSGLRNAVVIVNPKPKAAFTINDDEQCFNGHRFQFTNTSGVLSGGISHYLWRFGDNSSSVLMSPPDKTYPQAGTYTTTLTVQSDSACTDSTAAELTLNPSPEPDVDAVSPVCLGDSTRFQSKSRISSGRIVAYSWNFGDNKVAADSMPAHVYDRDGWYNVTLDLVSDKGCAASKQFIQMALVHPLPDAQIKYSIAEGEQNNSLIRFMNATPTATVSARWNFGRFGYAYQDSSLSLQDTATIQAILQVTDANGCTGIARESLFASGPLLVFFPNAFTPNSDELNELFMPRGVINTESYKFTIYNRWGELVYESSEPYKGWDGRYMEQDSPQDVYTYLLQIQDYKGNPKVYRGTFTLIR